MDFPKNNACRAVRRALRMGSVCVVASVALWLVIRCISPLETFASLPSPASPSVEPSPTASTSATASQSPVAAQTMPVSATPTNLESTSKITGIIESVLKDVALIVGGLFAYWKFFMGRTFQPRLEPSVSASARVEENQTSLSVVCKLKNVGLSRVDLDREASVLRVS
jgi:hypothetical protein